MRRNADDSPSAYCKAIDSYVRLANHYDLAVGVEYYPRLLEIFDGLAKDYSQGARHLDIGCGTGFLLSHSAAMGFSAQGVDISESMVATAKQLRPHIPITLCDVMGIHNAQWDVITANNDVLNHLAHRHGVGRLFSHLCGMLTPGGVILTDAVSDFDILNNWSDCVNIYSDCSTFKCVVSHEVIDYKVPIGRMRRHWTHPSRNFSLDVLIEEELVPGLSIQLLRDAASAVGLFARFFDWESGGDACASTIRIGLILRHFPD